MFELGGRVLGTFTKHKGKTEALLLQISDRSRMLQITSMGKQPLPQRCGGPAGPLLDYLSMQLRLPSLTTQQHHRHSTFVGLRWFSENYAKSTKTSTGGGGGGGLIYKMWKGVGGLGASSFCVVLQIIQ